MSGTDEKQWFVMQTKLGKENLAVSHVKALGLEILFPRMKRERFVRGISREIIKPLFPGYFFSRFRISDYYTQVKYLPGILRILGTDNSPIPVPESVLQLIKDGLEDGDFIISPMKIFGCGDRVRIDSGPFQGLVGKIVNENNDGRRVQILLETIQQARLTTEQRWLTVADVA